MLYRDRPVQLCVLTYWDEEDHLQRAVDRVGAPVDREGVSVEGDLALAFAAVEPMARGTTSLNGPVPGAGHYNIESVSLRLCSPKGHDKPHTSVPDVGDGQVALARDADGVLGTLGAEAFAGGADGILAGGAAEDEVVEVDVGAGDGEVEHDCRRRWIVEVSRWV